MKNIIVSESLSELNAIFSALRLERKISEDQMSRIEECMGRICGPGLQALKICEEVQPVLSEQVALADQAMLDDCQMLREAARINDVISASFGWLLRKGEIVKVEDLDRTCVFTRELNGHPKPELFIKPEGSLAGFIVTKDDVRGYRRPKNCPVVDFEPGEAVRIVDHVYHRIQIEDEEIRPPFAVEK